MNWMTLKHFGKPTDIAQLRLVDRQTGQTKRRIRVA